ncbi:MAG: hypothetical protein AB8A46_07740 [Prochlorococcus sp.]|jgi:hypothetical protein|nr:hypothetical protein [Prochlorococcaceae cyanobacterium ETNP18_MAG_1]CAI8178097.1 MAG: Uncharacterised protein [Prochlorococcus marinus str. MIT 9215]
MDLIVLPSADQVMENSSSESSMHVLVWGIGLLGAIGMFIVWGLANAYPAAV